MGQRECLSELENNHKWFTVEELKTLLNIHSSAVNDSLRRLVKGGYVVKKKQEHSTRGILYKIKGKKDC